MLHLVAVAAAVVAQPSSADLGFMVGEWQLTGAFNPGTAQELKETGTRHCVMSLANAYVRCDWTLTNAEEASGNSLAITITISSTAVSSICLSPLTGRLR